jgi:hypothetical protein
MKIVIDKNVVEFRPESPGETSDLETLWRVVVDCIQDSKSMQPIGEYIPAKSDVARFVIEGVPGGKTTFSADTVDEECTVVCLTCNKYSALKPGDQIPLCCGKPMEDVD